MFIFIIHYFFVTHIMHNYRLLIFLLRNTTNMLHLLDCAMLLKKTSHTFFSIFLYFLTIDTNKEVLQIRIFH